MVLEVNEVTQVRCIIPGCLGIAEHDFPLCDTCFMDSGHRSAGLRIATLENALFEIACHPHLLLRGGEPSGHECAARIAREALEEK